MQQLLVNKEDVLPEQEEWNRRLDQKGSKPPNIKEEQEDLWVRQEGKQPHELGEADITKLSFTAVSLKSEDEEKPQSSQLHQNERDEVELLPSNSTEHKSLKIEAKDEDCGGSQPATGPCSRFQPHADAVIHLGPLQKPSNPDGAWRLLSSVTLAGSPGWGIGSLSL
ncbi:uncharacterized protein LOC117510128 isoform X3 [Thalassophryne amazonica]|uniref:uncharacterized protein LOC117510128 isoform X3 n=1 Tax=Thalassophryne amazonica TaxID=390379 RepID=UPI001471C47F|nr:uncharacterized protein LOC117510128 isoform X3 [Thalassophryne amazonica]